jgi:outer membrane receptor protein involved in Fe transport
MRFMRSRMKMATGLLAICAAFAVCIVSGTYLASVAYGQSLLAGDISGTIVDPNGAAVSGATVKVTSKDTGTTATTITSGTGLYRFSLLKPGTYTVAVSASGFKATTATVVVSLGQVATANIALTLGSASETVEVTAGTPLLQTDSAELSTGFEYEQLQSVPNPGGDITYVAQTAPGVVMNTGGGYGNFSVFGLPGTSNNFTMNGMETNDPFLNLNNSGPSNLLLGLNDVQEVNVVTNAYGVQYGSFGGAQVNSISRSGSNRFHGNANYWWNGRSLNANNWFNTGNPKPFANTNQWAAAVGGPIKRDHTFFFANYEGLSFITAPVSVLFMPSPAYQQSVVGNNGACSDASSSLFNAGAGGECAFYNNIFNIYNNVPNHAAATAVTDANGNPTGQLQLTATPKTNLSEKLVTARLDQVFNDQNKLFLHFKYDHGVQPTYTDPFNPVFNMQSDQPDYEGQLSWTHIFSQKAVNQVLITGSWYSAIFKSVNQAAATALLPETLNFGDLDGFFTDLNPDGYIFPQGRNAFQDQFGDDFSYTMAKHTLKFGALYKKDYVSDYDATEFTTPLLLTCGTAATCNTAIGANVGNLLGQGLSLEAIQSFPLASHVPISLYSLGFYVQDDWKPLENLTLNMGVRVERNSNPYSSHNVLSNFGTDFSSFVGTYGANSNATAYNTMIKSGLSNAFLNFQRAMVEPRLGFTFSPDKSTVLRGGVGFFTDVFPGTIADSELFNPPFNPQFTIFFGGIDPSQSYSSAQQAAALNTAFQQGFSTGGTADSITAADPNFAPPNFTSVAKNLQYPTYEEWNLQIQRELGRGNAVQVSYVGNHGYHEPVQNGMVNAYGSGPLPSAPPVSAFGAVTEVRSTASSNYAGLVTSFVHKGKSLNMQLNYTWSHALDEISNGGILPFATGNITSQIDPNNLAHNYGNADYDIRNYFNGNYLYMLPHFGGPKLLTAGWELSGVIFLHSGLPFTVTESAFAAASGNVGGTGVVQVAAAPGTPHRCGSSSARTPCLTAADFPTAGDPASVFAPYDRNQFVGPGYFDTDMTLAKVFTLHEGLNVRLGATAYNLFNHPNFASPVSDVTSPNFGQSFSTVSPPTSIYGAFLGGDASVRILQLTGKINF